MSIGSEPLLGDGEENNLFSVNDVYLTKSFLFCRHEIEGFFCASGASKMGLLGKMALPDEMKGDVVYFYKNPVLSFFSKKLTVIPNVSMEHGASAMFGTSCWVVFDHRHGDLQWRATFFQVFGNAVIPQEVFTVFCSLADKYFDHSDRRADMESGGTRVYDKYNSSVNGTGEFSANGSIKAALSPANKRLIIANQRENNP